MRVQFRRATGQQKGSRPQGGGTPAEFESCSSQTVYFFFAGAAGGVAAARGLAGEVSGVVVAGAGVSGSAGAVVAGAFVPGAALLIRAAGAGLPKVSSRTDFGT